MSQGIKSKFEKLSIAHETVRNTECPSCGCELAEGNKVAGCNEPSGNDVSICWACGEIIIVRVDECGITLRLATVGEFLSLSEDDQDVLRVAFELIREQQQRQSVRVASPLS